VPAHLLRRSILLVKWCSLYYVFSKSILLQQIAIDDDQDDTANAFPEDTEFTIDPDFTIGTILPDKGEEVDLANSDDTLEKY
jgi:hypothetical protein